MELALEAVRTERMEAQISHLIEYMNDNQEIPSYIKMLKMEYSPI